MRIVLAVDHRLVLDALEAYIVSLRPDIEILRAHTFAETEKHAVTADEIDLIVLDFYMPGVDGVKGIVRLREGHPDVPVVVLSGSADSRVIRQALENGAAGFIPKDLSGKAMLSALELVLSGGSYIPEAALMQPDEDGDGLRQRLPDDSPLQTLTPREFEVLGCLAARRVVVLRNFPGDTRNALPSVALENVVGVIVGRAW